MKTATAVTNAERLPVQGRSAERLPVQERSEACEIIRLPTLGTFSIYCDGVLHARMQGTAAMVRNRVVELSSSRPEHDWGYE